MKFLCPTLYLQVFKPLLYDGAIIFFLFKNTVAQVVEALRYWPEIHGFNSRWCRWNFSLV